MASSQRRCIEFATEPEGVPRGVHLIISPTNPELQTFLKLLNSVFYHTYPGSMKVTLCDGTNKGLITCLINNRKHWRGTNNLQLVGLVFHEGTQREEGSKAPISFWATKAEAGIEVWYVTWRQHESSRVLHRVLHRHTFNTEWDITNDMNTVNLISDYIVSSQNVIEFRPPKDKRDLPWVKYETVLPRYTENNQIPYFKGPLDENSITSVALQFKQIFEPVQCDIVKECFNSLSYLGIGEGDYVRRIEHSDRQEVFQPHVSSLLLYVASIDRKDHSNRSDANTFACPALCSIKHGPTNDLSQELEEQFILQLDKCYKEKNRQLILTSSHYYLQFVMEPRKLFKYLSLPGRNSNISRLYPPCTNAKCNCIGPTSGHFKCESVEKYTDK